MKFKKGDKVRIKSYNSNGIIINRAGRFGKNAVWTVYVKSVKRSQLIYQHLLRKVK